MNSAAALLFSRAGQCEPLGPPRREGCEILVDVRLSDGRGAVLCSLAPDLASDEAICRRYTGEVEALQRRTPASVASILDHGPRLQDGHESLRATEAPWRLRAPVEGRSLEAWLDSGPHPEVQVRSVGGLLAEAIALVHDAGLVLRGFNPSFAVLSPDQRVMFTDLGFTRVERLSTRTQRSLVLRASPYVAPELMFGGLTDPRSDVYALGAFLWRAVTGRSSRDPVDLADCIAGAPGGAPNREALMKVTSPALTEVILRCLEHDPGERPGDAREVAELLRGELEPAHRPTVLPCPACKTPMEEGTVICPGCAKDIVPLRSVDDGSARRFDVVLVSLDGGPEVVGRLHDLLTALSAGPLPSLHFAPLHDWLAHLGATQDRILPHVLFDRLPQPLAEDVEARLTAEGFKVTLSRSPTMRRGWLTPKGLLKLALTPFLMIAATLGPILCLFVGDLWWSLCSLVVAGLALLRWFYVPIRRQVALQRACSTDEQPLPRIPAGSVRGSLGLRLRASPSRLPALDPVFLRLRTILQLPMASDVRREVGRLTTLLTRFANARASAGTVERAQLGLYLHVIEGLAGAIEGHVKALAMLDATISEDSLDETRLARELAQSDLRNQPAGVRAALLRDLDRLRELEDQRGRLLIALLRAGGLLRRATRLALADVQTEAEQLAEARRLLEPPEPSASRS